MSSSIASPIRVAILAIAALATAALAQAQLAFNVTVDTSALSGSVANPLYLDFQLNDGAGWGDANNTATISGFNFGGGMALAPATTFGGASGDLWTSVALNDSFAFNEFFQPFVPGSTLTFTVSLTDNVDWMTPPDLFAFAILDTNLFNIATNAPGTDTFVQVNLDGPNPTIESYSSVDGLVAAPQIVPVPEASTYGLGAALALLGLACYRRFATKR